MNCPQCSNDNPADARFCQNCGRPLPPTCTACGTLNLATAKFCKHCGTPLLPSESVAQAVDRLTALQRSAPLALQDKLRATAAQLEGARKPVTILFTDIVGSTSLAEKLDPEDWRTILMGAHQRVSEAVYRYEGTIAQLLGDGVLAFFGAPITHEDDPVRAVRAALDIQRAIQDYAEQLRNRIDNFQLRVGINTGVVVVGNIGSDLHMEYLAIGDAVNLAARLQSAAQPGRVLISEATEKLVKAAIDLTALGEITVKGKANPIKVFEVVDRKAVPLSGRGLEGLISPLVGREHELAALRTALAELAAGHGRIVTVMGEAGIGKTRLVEEARHMSPLTGVRWLEGRALSYGQTLSFWIIAQLIKHDLGLSDIDPETTLTAALHQRVTELFGPEADEIGLLAQVLGVKLDGEAAQRMARLRTLDAETLKRRLFDALTAYFARVAQAQPTVLVFEDLHWADPSSLQVLESLLTLTEHMPLMVILLARLENDSGWWPLKQRAETEHGQHYTEIQLKPLSADEQNQLVDELLPIANLPDALRRLMLERAEGNPFYLEEVIRSLIEQGALVREADQWQATTDIAHIELPPTLQGVLLARIDRLHEDVRRTLQLAAVIGRTFLYRLLEAIADAEQQLDAELSELQQADLVREKSRLPDLEYMFKHALTQEAAYNSLLIERRKVFHRQVGEALERLFADRLDEVYGLLAYHFGAAGEVEKTIEYANKAGDRARALFAYHEAIAYYQQALAGFKAQQDYEQAARTLMKIGLLYHTVFDFIHSRQTYDEGCSLWQRASQCMPDTSLPPAPHALRVASRPPLTLDPGLVIDPVSGVIVHQLFSGLVELTFDMDVMPEVAQSWEVLDGGRQYLFHLQSGTCWSDGTALTAHDFEFAWKRALDPQLGTTAAQLLYVVKGAQAFHQGQVPTPQAVGVRALDDLTLAVELNDPTGYFFHLLTHSITHPVPRHVVEQYGPAWTNAGHLVGNGAFRLEDEMPDHSLILSRNPYYRGRFNGNVQRIDIAITDDTGVSLAWYEANRLDVANVPHFRLNEIQHCYAAEYRTAPFAATDCIGFDLGLPPFDDVRVRRAFAHALDRDVLVNRIMGGAWFPATGGFVPPGIPEHSPGIGLTYDPETARRLLSEAGYPNGQGLPALGLKIPNLAIDRSRLAEYLIGQWHAVLGNNIVVTLVDNAVQTQERVDLTGPTLFYGGWLADYPDADCFLRYVPVPKWHHPMFDQLIETASRTSDQAERRRLYQAADHLFIDEAVVIPLWYGRWHVLVKPWISNLGLSPIRKQLWKYVIIEPH